MLACVFEEFRRVRHEIYILALLTLEMFFHPILRWNFLWKLTFIILTPWMLAASIFVHQIENKKLQIGETAAEASRNNGKKKHKNHEMSSNTVR